MQVQSAQLNSISFSSNDSFKNIKLQDSKLSKDALIIEKTLGFQINNRESKSDKTGNLSKALTANAQKIIDNLNQLLKDKLPGGLQSLKPQDVTPEASADRVVTGVTALFDAFARQNKDLSPDELVAKFIEQAKKGVETGYSEAKSILGDLGAFSFEGIEDSIAKTKDLIMEKLDKFAEFKLEQLTQGVSEKSSELSRDELLSVASDIYSA